MAAACAARVSDTLELPVTAILFVIASFALAYQIWVSVLLVRAGGVYSRNQLIVQLCLVWLMPFLGAPKCHFFFKLTSTYEPSHEKKFIQREGLDCDILTNHHIDDQS